MFTILYMYPQSSFQKLPVPIYMRKQRRTALGFLATLAEVCVIFLHDSNLIGIK